jgi:hypothetical protein
VADTDLPAKARSSAIYACRHGQFTFSACNKFALRSLVAAILLALLYCSPSMQCQTVQRWEIDGKPYPTIEQACNALLETLQNNVKSPATLASIERLHEAGMSGAVCHLEYYAQIPGSAQIVLEKIRVTLADMCSSPAKPSGYCSPERPSNIVIIKITGTIAYGSDPSGIFGTATHDLKGKRFSLLYHFDDTKGVNQVVSCIGPACASRIQTITGKSSPGTAELRIEGGPPQTFGLSADADSSLQKNTYPCCAYGRTYLLNFDVRDREGSVVLTVMDTAKGATATKDGDWRAPFIDPNVFQLTPDTSDQDEHGFNIRPRGKQAAFGALVPETVCVGSACN